MTHLCDDATEFHVDQNGEDHGNTHQEEEHHEKGDAHDIFPLFKNYADVQDGEDWHFEYRINSEHHVTQMVDSWTEGSYYHETEVIDGFEYAFWWQSGDVCFEHAEWEVGEGYQGHEPYFGHYHKYG